MLTRSFLILAGVTLAAANLQAQAQPDLSDPEVAHVAVTANTVDIEMGSFAKSHARDSAVRHFADIMVIDHSAVNKQAATLAGRLGVTPKDNAVSQSLQSGAAEARQKLEGLRGNAFDRAYMDREVAYHQAVLEALDGLLIPTTENADLKNLLIAVRPAIAAHLEHARQVRSQLGAGAAQ